MSNIFFIFLSVVKETIWCGCTTKTTTTTTDINNKNKNNMD